MHLPDAHRDSILITPAISVQGTSPDTIYDGDTRSRLDVEFDVLDQMMADLLLRLK